MTGRSIYKVYYAVGTLLIIAGNLTCLAVASNNQEKIMLIGTVFLCFGSSFLAVLPLWKRILLLDEKSALAREGPDPPSR